MSKEYKRVVDNKMRWYGDIDDEKNIIRINKSKKKNTKLGDILNSIVHEERHLKHPQEHEDTIRKKTLEEIKHMTRKQKQRLYALYK